MTVSEFGVVSSLVKFSDEMTVQVSVSIRILGKPMMQRTQRCYVYTSETTHLHGLQMAQVSGSFLPINWYQIEAVPYKVKHKYTKTWNFTLKYLLETKAYTHIRLT